MALICCFNFSILSGSASALMPMMTRFGSIPKIVRISSSLPWSWGGSICSRVGRSSGVNEER
ncbi:hypothetical protein DJ031_07475 [bacterium endosymbiont of Escarpia laminata]|nr:MAG: hypothetical protein DJ031_07475 [bacterium endosymbiont of Escarpia laminata]